MDRVGLAGLSNQRLGESYPHESRMLAGTRFSPWQALPAKMTWTRLTCMTKGSLSRLARKMG